MSLTLEYSCKTIFSFEELENEVHWNVIQEDKKYKIILDIYCKTKDMLFINYEAPSGKKLHNKLFNGGNGYGTLNLYSKNKKKIN